MHASARAEQLALALASVDVLIVDDNLEIVELMKRALRADGHSIEVAHTCGELEAAVEARAFDIIILDVELPDCSGIDACRKLRMHDDATPVMIVTAHDSVADRVEGLDAGADDFLGKPFDVSELRARVRAIIRRGAGLEKTWRCRDVVLELSRRRAFVAGREVAITSREWAILDVLAAARGKIVPRHELLAMIWGDDWDGAASSLEVLIGRIRKKLGKDLVRTLRGEGYALESLAT